MATDWRADVEPHLSQGDIVADVPLGPVAHPAQKLQRRNVKGVGDAFVIDAQASPDSNGWNYWLARGPFTAVVVLSHSCDLDKNEKKGRVVVAQVTLADRLDPQVRDAVFQRRRIALVPLVAVPSLGDSYADLRTTTGVDRRHLEGARRIASMTDQNLQILQQAIAGFFVRNPVVP